MDPATEQASWHSTQPSSPERELLSSHRLVVDAGTKEDLHRGQHLVVDGTANLLRDGTLRLAGYATGRDISAQQFRIGIDGLRLIELAELVENLARRKPMRKLPARTLGIEFERMTGAAIDSRMSPASCTPRYPGPERPLPTALEPGPRNVVFVAVESVARIAIL